MNRIKNILIKIKGLKRFFSISFVKRVARTSVKVATFVVLLFSYLGMTTITKITHSRFFPQKVTNRIFPPLDNLYQHIVSTSKHNENNINRINLIEMAIKNMGFKMTRTVITIGGMSVGIAAIVFLVSLGYGVEKLVTARVARLDELKQANVNSQPGSNIRINDKYISNFKDLPEVKDALPLIELVGKVSFQGSVTDMAVYGVTTEYLKQSAIKTVHGDLFTSNEISVKNAGGPSPAVAGASVEIPEIGTIIQEVEFTITPAQWLEIYEEPSENSKLLGYTKRVEGIQTGTEFWGTGYEDLNGLGSILKDNQGNEYGKWIKSKVFIWQQDEENDRMMVEEKSEEGNHIQKEGYLKEMHMSITGINFATPQVLGISEVLAESDEATESTSAGGLAVTETEDGWVTIEGENIDEAEKVTKVDLREGAVKQAVVNRAMLKILSIPQDQAIGKEFEVSFIVPGSLLETQEEKLESNLAKYKIVGVIPQDDTPFFYVPFIDLRGLGIANYSQVKVVTNSTEELSPAREKIESMGFVTNSVVDTVSQINSLFGTVRKILALIGTVALVVASLGMFNTLTVSLLERTREIGLMKALGMKSHEVEELFLTESMVMGIFGGVFGILFGFLAGKFVGLLLSVVAVAKGVGYVDISYIPPGFILLILGLSVTVGLLTGVYPARRATKISALNALRYE